MKDVSEKTGYKVRDVIIDIILVTEKTVPKIKEQVQLQLYNHIDHIIWSEICFKIYDSQIII